MNNRIVRFGLAAAAVAAIALIGIILLTRSDFGAQTGAQTGAQLTPSPTLTPPPPSATVSLDVSDDGQVRNGLLDPGTYTYADVDGQGFNVQFTVPAGWTWNGRYLSKGGVGLPDGAAVFFFGGPVQAYADPCHWAAAQSTPPAGFSSYDIVAALVAQPTRSATTPINAPRGPWTGTAVELTTPDNINLAECDQSQFRSWGPKPNARVHQGPGQRDLVWAVDVPGAGVTNKGPVPPPAGGLIIDAASFQGTPADVMSEIEAILGSIYVGHWG